MSSCRPSIRDNIPSVRAAGIAIAKAADHDTVGAALRIERPPTPDNIARYRASRRQSRPGAADQRFGAVSNNSGDNAYNLLHTAETSEIAQYFLERKEAIYASRQKEPLGRAFTRGHVLPPQTREAGFQFGVTSQKGDDVRTSLYPAAAEPAPAPTFYRKSAGESSNSVDGRSVDRIRQQRRRDDWRKLAIDPGSYRFGAPPLPPTATPSSNAADLLAPKRPLLIGMRRREDHKAAHQHVVGRAKQPPVALRSAPEQYVPLTKAPGNAEWGAKECITGEWSAGDRATASDLGRGKIVTPVDTNAIVPAGTPSIRKSKQPPTHRSLASTINYGDGPVAHELLYPPKFSFSGIRESDFTETRSVESLRNLFDASGLAVTDDQFIQIREEIARCGQPPTILTYQAAFNKVMNVMIAL
ncbi:EF-hand domain-containing protein [Plasmodiophora brassicae]|uniref:EFHB C-terminal EF-hand domain-containing protein n=1 Tax=Plasmodiophora brassicae TaxID=37360 RepID=A0A3P3Y8H2_PLABS|nr:unnamed protein product [Plasmodiophora brassicae]